MTDRVGGSKPVREGIAIGAVLLVAALRFWSELHTGLGLSDEGHLWYATLRTRAGEIPIHDFRSYDPARYWWLATFSRIWGEGIVGVRAGSALFALLGLGLGMLAARRGVKNPAWLFALGALSAVWMFPQHKLFEHGLVLAALWAGVCFLERPTREAHLGAGIFVGIAACFGRNHGLYLLVAFLLLVLFARIAEASVGSGQTIGAKNPLSIRPPAPLRQRPPYPVQTVSLFVAGALVGYLPVLAHILLVDGFAHSFWESVLHGTGVLSKAVPWFWTYPYTRTAWLENFSGFLLGLAFLVVPLFYLGVGASIAARLRSDPQDASRIRLLAVCVAVGGPYLHHAFGRADASHLAQAIHPFLISSVSLALWGVERTRESGPDRKRMTSTLVGASVLLAYVGATTCVVFLTRSDLGERILSRSATPVAYEVRGDLLRLSTRERDYLQWVRDFVEQNVRPDENIYIGPYRAGLYAVLDRPSPVWETFFQWPVTDERQRAMIRDFDRNRVDWAIVYTYAVDGKIERDPAHTMPLVWEYLQREFEPFAVAGLPKDHLCLRRRIG